MVRILVVIVVDGLLASIAVADAIFEFDPVRFPLAVATDVQISLENTSDELWAFGGISWTFLPAPELILGTLAWDPVTFADPSFVVQSDPPELSWTGAVGASPVRVAPGESIVLGAVPITIVRLGSWPLLLDVASFSDDQFQNLQIKDGSERVLIFEVPEPATIVLVMLGVLVVSLRGSGCAR